MKKILKQKLRTDRIDRVSKIIHIADIHIRNYKRHEEYKLVFDRVFEFCNKTISNDPNTIIYVAGDVVHAKTDLSPELVSMTHSLLSSLANLAPTILIPGNHDANLNNLNRLDALSPIVDAINHPELFYLKDTGIFTLSNVDFVHNSIFDDPDNFLTANDVNSDNVKIVLFHGPIDRAKMDQGIEMKNNRITMTTFKDFDYGLFGDIHSFQYLDENDKFAYAGSLIQQNFGEKLDHGVLLWDLEEGSSNFFNIENDWGYYTIDVDAGKFIQLPKKFSIHNRIRVKSYNTSNSDLMKLISKLKSKIKIDDIRIHKFSNEMVSNSSTSSIKMIDVRDVEYQNKLITNYLEKNHTIDDKILDEVRKINRNLNSQIVKLNAIRNVIWTPVCFEFENMFSYAGENTIDFSSMNGTYGLFAKNAEGKSSAIDSLMFCIFDKCSRTFKASQVLNNKKNSFKCKFQFKISGRDYFIERSGTKDKLGHVKVNVDFWYEEDDSVVSLNGDDRDGTNSIIRSYLGTYDDFIITAVSLQNNNTNFIDKTQRDRKDLLAQFLDLNVFDELNDMAIEEIKSVQTLIKEFNRQDYSTQISSANDLFKELSNKLSKLIKSKAELLEETDSFNSSILELTKQLKPIDEELASIDLKQLISTKDKLSKSLVNNDALKSKLQIEMDSLLIDISTLKGIFDNNDKDSLLSRKLNQDNLVKRLTTLSNEFDKKTLEIKHHKTKVDNLQTHEYDPECEYCVNNIFVQDAIQSKSILKTLNKEYSKLKLEIKSLKSEDDSHVYNILETLNRNEIKQTELNRKVFHIEKEINNLNIDISKISLNISNIETSISKYLMNETTIKENQSIQMEILDLEIHKENVAKKLYEIEDKIIDISGQVKVHEKIINDCAIAIKKLQELEKEYLAYDYYLKAVNRNGVPYDLISDAIPKVQVEVNSILSQIVEFEIMFETDGKSINTYIVYDDENFWPLEMTSGMEKFISSLAIRTALINISSLPRPNFIVIDEGLGNLDSSVIGNFSMFLEYMKTQFDFIILISHIDVVRDIVDTQIDIKKENGFSYVKY